MKPLPLRKPRPAQQQVAQQQKWWWSHYPSPCPHSQAKPKVSPWALVEQCPPPCHHPTVAALLCWDSTATSPIFKKGEVNIISICMVCNFWIHTQCDSIKWLWEVGDTGSFQLERKNMLGFLTNPSIFFLSSTLFLIKHYFRKRGNHSLKKQISKQGLMFLFIFFWLLSKIQ